MHYLIFLAGACPHLEYKKNQEKEFGVEDIKEKKGCFARRFEHFISDFS